MALEGPCRQAPTAHPCPAGPEPAWLRLLLLELLHVRLEDPARARLPPGERAFMPLREAEELLPPAFRLRFGGAELEPPQAGLRPMVEAACADVVAVRFVKLAERSMVSGYSALPAFCAAPKATIEAAWVAASRHGPIARTPPEELQRPPPLPLPEAHAVAPPPPPPSSLPGRARRVGRRRWPLPARAPAHARRG
jgi:hypothetical protein